LIFHDALAPFDESLRRRLRANIRELLPDISIIWLDREVQDPNEFDQVLEFTAEGPLEQTNGKQLSTGASELHVSKPGVAPPAFDDIDQNDPFALINCSQMFSNLSSSQQQFLADHSKAMTMDAQKTVYRAGDEADSVYLIVSGQIVSTKGDGTVMGRLGRMEVMGLLETLAGRPRMLTSKTVSEARLLRIDADAIHDISEDDSVVMKKLLQAVTQQFVAGNNIDSGGGDGDDQAVA